EVGDIEAGLDEVLPVGPGEHIGQLRVIFLLERVALRSTAGKSVQHHNLRNTRQPARRGRLALSSSKRQLVDDSGGERRLVSEIDLMASARQICAGLRKIEA